MTAKNAPAPADNRGVDGANKTLRSYASLVAHATSANGASPTRRRRTAAEIEGIREAIWDVVFADSPVTVRQVFYRLVSGGAIAKTELEYKQTVCRLLTEMRLSGDIPFQWIADNTRWMRKPRTFSSLENALKRTADTYRRALWDNQDAYVEIWLEKDALAGVLYDVTAEFDVPLMVTRGYPSLSYLHTAAETIAEIGKPAHLYYFGDHDPSGLDIPRNVEARLRQFAPDAEIHFERAAVTPEQIARWQLPTRPTKTKDTRSKGFEGESVEVDAIPPDELRSLARTYIDRHIDKRQLEMLRVIEAEERRSLATIAGGAA